MMFRNPSKPTAFCLTRSAFNMVMLHLNRAPFLVISSKGCNAVLVRSCFAAAADQPGGESTAPTLSVGCCLYCA